MKTWPEYASHGVRYNKVTLCVKGNARTREVAIIDQVDGVQCVIPRFDCIIIIIIIITNLIKICSIINIGWRQMNV